MLFPFNYISIISEKNRDKIYRKYMVIFAD